MTPITGPAGIGTDLGPWGQRVQGGHDTLGLAQARWATQGAPRVGTIGRNNQGSCLPA